MMKISIIIPVFNTYELLERLLLSILDKDVNGIDLQIIVVDDGSNYSVADKLNYLLGFFSEKGVNLVFFRQENAGPGAARNKGLKHATGEYIWFSDADDLIVNECFQDFLKSSPFKVLEFGYYDEFLNKYFIPQIKHSSCTIDYLRLCDGRFYLWNKIFHKDALLGAFFNEELMSLEDYCFCVNIFMHNYPMKYLTNPYYEYKLNAESITKNITLDKKKRMSKDTRVVQDFLFNLKEKQTNSYEKKIIDRLLVINFSGYIYSLYKHKYSKDYIHQAFDYYKTKGKVFFNPFYFLSYNKRRLLLFVLFLNLLSLKFYIKRLF